MSAQPAQRVTVTAFEPEYDISAVEVCLTCFGLRGSYTARHGPTIVAREHRCSCEPTNDPQWREANWAGFDIPAAIAMCNLCCRRPLKTGSRWSWLACDRCRNVNIRVGEAIAGPRHFVLPLGRHSMMNGTAIRLADADSGAINKFAGAVLESVRSAMALAKWRREEGERLAETVPLVGDSVPLARWMLLFPSSLGASTDAFCRYLGIDLPVVPVLARLTETLDAFRSKDASYEERLLDMTVDRVDH